MKGAGRLEREDVKVLIDLVKHITTLTSVVLGLLATLLAAFFQKLALAPKRSVQAASGVFLFLSIVAICYSLFSAVGFFMQLPDRPRDDYGTIDFLPLRFQFRLVFILFFLAMLMLGVYVILMVYATVL